MLALDWGGQRYGWASRQALGLIACSALMWLLFVWRLRTAPEPLIPAEVLANPVVARGIVCACLGMGTFIGLSAFLPVYFESAYGLSASHSGLALIPFMVGTVTGATISGRIMARVVNYKLMPLIGLVVAALGCGLLALLPDRLPLLWLEVLLPAISVGLGAMLPVTTVAVQNAVEPHQLGTTTGTMNFFRSLGGALVVALFGALLFGALPELSAASLQLKDGAGFGIDAARAVAAFRPIYGVSAVGLALAYAALAVMPQWPLRSRLPGVKAEAH
jgi:predicted MFS family arabinose efflux permease